MSINKFELIDFIAKKGNISKIEAKKALKLTIKIMIEALIRNTDIMLIGLRIFKLLVLTECIERIHKRKMQCKLKLQKQYGLKLDLIYYNNSNFHQIKPH